VRGIDDPLSRPPQVDVIIPTRNRATLTAEALASVEAQTFGTWRAYLVDDASDDGSVDALRAMAARDPRVTLVVRPERGGPQVARQTGLDAAQGPLVAILDSDDLWEPAKLERQVAVFTDAASAGRPLDAVLAAYRWVDASGPERVVTPPRQASSRIWVTNNLSTLLVSRATLDAVGGFLPTGQRPVSTCEHTELCLRMGTRWRLRVVPEPLVTCRGHRGARASDLSNSRLAAEELAFVLDRHRAVLSRFPDVSTGMQAQLAARWLEAGERAVGVSGLVRAMTAAGPRAGLRLARRYGPFALRALLPRR
jgi:glycosyltransferase involved in cell wall biosynthesis